MSKMPSSKSKSKLETMVSNNRMQSEHNKKKQSLGRSVCSLIKRSNTPSIDCLKYPEPEVILKEIEKNVNVLREIYQASVSERDRMKNSLHQTETCQNGKSQDKLPEKQFSCKRSVP